MAHLLFLALAGSVGFGVDLCLKWFLLWEKEMINVDLFPTVVGWHLVWVVG